MKRQDNDSEDGDPAEAHEVGEAEPAWAQARRGARVSPHGSRVGRHRRRVHDAALALADTGVRGVVMVPSLRESPLRAGWYSRVPSFAGGYTLSTGGRIGGCRTAGAGELTIVNRVAARRADR